MRIKDNLDRDWILVHQQASDKAALFRLLADEVLARLPALDRRALLGRLEEREQQASTGIGNGVAVPHTTVDGLEHIKCLLAVLPEGLEFEAVDGEPVYFVCLLLGPSDAVGSHLKVLARLARLVRRPEFVRDACAATTADEVYDLVVREDESHVE